MNDLEPLLGKDVHCYETHIKISQLDTLGHVNNAVYLEIFEEARWNYLDSHEMGLKQMQESRIGPVILEVNVQFKRELHLNEKIKILSDYKLSGGRFGRIHQEIYKEDGKLSAVAVYKFALFDLDKRKMIKPTESWLKMVNH